MEESLCIVALVHLSSCVNSGWLLRWVQSALSSACNTERGSFKVQPVPTKEDCSAMWTNYLSARFRGHLISSRPPPLHRPDIKQILTKGKSKPYRPAPKELLYGLLKLQMVVMCALICPVVDIIVSRLQLLCFWKATSSIIGLVWTYWITDKPWCFLKNEK